VKNDEICWQLEEGRSHFTDCIGERLELYHTLNPNKKIVTHPTLSLIFVDFPANGKKWYELIFIINNELLEILLKSGIEEFKYKYLISKKEDFSVITQDSEIINGHLNLDSVPIKLKKPFEKFKLYRIAEDINSEYQACTFTDVILPAFYKYLKEQKKLQNGL